MTKKPYKKPEIKKVKLAPEEAVLQFCKNAAATTGPQQAGCKRGVNPCDVAGT